MMLGRCGYLRWLSLLMCWVALLLLVLKLLQHHPDVPTMPRMSPLLLLKESKAGPSTSTASVKTASPTGAVRPTNSTIASTGTAHPATDPHVPSESELRADIERRLPSLPIAYWHKHKNDQNKFFEKKDCAPLPSIYDLEFHNIYWQTLRSSVGTFHMFGAYMDVRNTSRIGPAVRILAVHDRIRPNDTIQCQLWFEEREAPVIVRVLEFKYLWNGGWLNYEDGIWSPYLIACVLPPDVRHLVPVSVSLVENACDRATNNMRVHYDPPAPPNQRKDFAVGVKNMDMQEDISVRLVEWIELVRLLGADKIFFYELHVHPNITKVLDYYIEQGTVAVTPLTLPGGQPNLPSLQHLYNKNKETHKRQMEMIAFNDCLYRHMYQYRWLVVMDIDEVIVPIEDQDWAGLLRRVLPLAEPKDDKPPRCSYYGESFYFLGQHAEEDSIPHYMHMLQHVMRTRNFLKPNIWVKAFHETDRVLTLHNHLPLECLGGTCNPYAMETRHAIMHHYRANCVLELTGSCKEIQANPVRDESLWRWSEPLVARVDHVLEELGFLPSNR